MKILLPLFIVIISLLTVTSCNGKLSFTTESGSHTESEIENLNASESENETETETETEPETEPPFAAVIAGVWEGSDIYNTTIIFDEDGTLYYRELNNPKIATVKGSVGTWDTEDEHSINIHLPWMGNGYELLATSDGQGGFILQCVNGQPWSDETIRKTDQTKEENDEKAKAKLATMLEDGEYFFDGNAFTTAKQWNDGTCVRIESGDGHYIEVTPEKCEMKVRLRRGTLWSFDGDEAPLDATFIIPFAADCSYGFGGIWYDEATNSWHDVIPTQQDFISGLYSDCINAKKYGYGPLMLDGYALKIKNGRIVVFGFFS